MGFQAERMVLARNRRGLNKSQLAKLVRVTPATIAAYENGRTEPTPTTMKKLAKELRFPESFFLAEMGDTVSLDGASFRALSRMTASQRGTALAAGTLCIALNDWIEERFDLPASNLPDLDPAVAGAEGAATQVRTEWGLGESPIPNLLHLVEGHGVRVFSLVEDCHEIDAFSFWRSGTPFICVNTTKTAERTVFDIAHELGHLVLHKGHAAPRGRDEEREADAFASNFLMPKADVEAAGLRNPDLAALAAAKTRWRVSTAALNYRLYKLNITSDWHYRELCIELARLGRYRELNPMPQVQSQVITKVLTALRAEGVTRSQIADALHIQLDELNGLISGLTITVVDGGDTPTAERGRPNLRLVTPSTSGRVPPSERSPNAS